MVLYILGLAFVLRDQILARVQIFDFNFERDQQRIEKLIIICL